MIKALLFVLPMAAIGAETYVTPASLEVAFKDSHLASPPLTLEKAAAANLSMGIGRDWVQERSTFNRLSGLMFGPNPKQMFFRPPTRQEEKKSKSVFRPKENVDYKLVVRAPEPGIDYKLLVIPVGPAFAEDK